MNDDAVNAGPGPPDITSRPSIGGILETVVYCRGNLAEMRVFYRDVLGLRQLGGDGFAFRAGNDVFLIFDSDLSSTQASPPPHGADGSVHTCFVTSPREYEAWKAHLAQEGVEIVQELSWKEGLRSFYFHDPAGNLLEIADGDIWPR